VNIFRTSLFVLTLAVFVCVAIISYKISFSSLTVSNISGITSVDYTNIVVILLTTVTILFTVAALFLALLGVIGFNNIKIEAGKFAKTSALEQINASFQEDGEALRQIRLELQKEKGPLRDLIERQIANEVTEKLALYSSMQSPPFTINENDPRDEGEQD
jgi:hypothetical protein